MALWHPAYLNHALLMQDWCHDLLLTFFWHCTCANLICCEEYFCVIIFCLLTKWLAIAMVQMLSVAGGLPHRDLSALWNIHFFAVSKIFFDLSAALS